VPTQEDRREVEDRSSLLPTFDPKRIEEA
jgi:hypothetical protein